MSGGYSLSEAAPVVNPGYYDTPICNKYSNKDIRDKEKTLTEYNFNSTINKTINDNKQQYLVQQYPTIPSTSLYIESDNPMSGYYTKLQKKSELKEDFTGTSAVDDYSYLYASDSDSGSFTPSNSYNSYYETHEMKPNYLSAQNLPNISNAYLNSQVSNSHGPDSHGSDSHSPDSHGSDSHGPDSHSPDSHRFMKGSTESRSDGNRNEIQMNNYRLPPRQINTKLLKNSNKILNMNIRKDDLIRNINNNINYETKKTLNKNTHRIPLEIASKNKLQNKLLNKKTVEYKNQKPKINLKKKNISISKNVETLSSVIFILAFVVLILTLLIFFRHFR